MKLADKKNESYTMTLSDKQLAAITPQFQNGNTFYNFSIQSHTAYVGSTYKLSKMKTLMSHKVNGEKNGQTGQNF